METDFTKLTQNITQTGIITDADVIAFRQAFYGDGHISMVEADQIFQANMSAQTKPFSWSEFMLEAMTDFTVHQVEPYGYVDDAKAAWLIQRISQDGIVETMTELRLLVNTVKTARDGSDRLVRFTLDQVKLAVTDGVGVIGRSRTLMPGQIGQAEVALLSDVLYACGGDNHIAITRTEAEVLFDLNDACRSLQNDPSWTKLFVNGITNYLMFLTSYNAPDRTEDLRRENWLNRPGDGVFAALKSLSTAQIGDAFRDVFGKEEQGELAAQEKARESAVFSAEAIDAGEAQWLRERIGRDGDFDENEQALIAHLKAESPNIHGDLVLLLDAAA